MITKIRLSSCRLRFINSKFPHQLSVDNAIYQGNLHKVIAKNIYSFSQEQKKRKIFEQIPEEDENGTQYTNWILARSQSHNHEIGHLKRKFLKDRFSIHKLTNIKFLCALANHKTEYVLNTNEKIILLAQLNHVFNILGKQKRYYNEFGLLSAEIIQQLKDPHDLICLGTFLSTLSNIGNYSYHLWLGVMDSLIVNKSDQEYDEIFGIVSALNRYREEIMEVTDFHELKSNMILQFIPVIYRNHLELMRQFIKFNIYNLKQCRILFKCLYSSKINEKYFWRSINDWFNIHLKDQLSKKNFEEFFIVNEKTIDKVINDDGMIRPRAILQEVTEIAYIIGENLSDGRGYLSEKDKYPMRRFLQFVQDLVLYSIQNGGNLYNEYLENYQNKVQTVNKDIKSNSEDKSQHQQRQSQQQQEIKINDEFEFKSQHQKERVKLMERQYKTLFINPIDIKNQTIIQLLVLMKKCCGYDHSGQPASKYNQDQSTPLGMNNNNKQQPSTNQTLFTRPQHLIDINVLKWLVMRLCKENMQYTISELLEIINCEDFLMFAKINLDELILSKLKNLRNTQVSLKDLKRLMLFLPVNRFTQLEFIMVNFLYKSHPSEIYELTKTIQLQSVSFNDQEYSQEFPRKEEHEKWVAHLQFYFLRLPELVNNHYKYYSFEENCYFLYYLLKNQIYWENHLPNLSENPTYSNEAHLLMNNYLGEMEKLKECVKIASYSRGFKLQMNSYFYKLLNYVDLVSFFEGGNA